MKDLRERAIRGGFAKVCAQAVTWIMRLGSLMVLARLLDPRDFGLVGMVTAFTGVLNLFRDFGLSSATVQRLDVSEEQLSTLFWINVGIGAALGLILAASSPFVAAFYREPHLLWVSIVLATAFIFNAIGVQHSALLQRQMRFTTIAVIDTACLVVSTSIAISMAMLGFRYWALVASAVSLPLFTTVCLWLATGWIPGRPRLRAEIQSMMRFGGGVTLLGLIVYIAYNLDKVVLGRFWGANAVGIYGRAYQLVTLPTDNLNYAIGGVALSALSRLQDNPQRLRSYFLKGYSLVLALTIPITIACALFAKDMILVVLGPKWKDAVDIFRLLAPTILVFALINPLWWLTCSLGMIGRNLKMVAVQAPLLIGSYVAGLRYGPKGVALGYSAMMVLWVVPCIVWSVHGTVVSTRNIMGAASRPLLSGVAAGAIASAVQSLCGPSLTPLLRLTLGLTVLLATYVGMLFYVMGQKPLYSNLLQGLRRRSPVEDSLASA
jgi:O-antigen/teichoic acid export membrane protein